MANDQEMSGWTDLLHSSSKLLEQAAPSSQFPPLQVLPLSAGFEVHRLRLVRLIFVCFTIREI